MPNVQFELVPVDYSKPYDEQPLCKRHVIGAYANLARHNLALAVNTTMQAIGMDTFNENDIDDAFATNHRKQLLKLDNIQKVNLQKRLYRHFTFLKRMKLEDKDKMTVQIKTLLEVMADFTKCMAMLRNFYTHYRPYNTPEEQEEQLELKKKMGERLTYLFENTSKLFKTNEKLSHEANEVLSALRVPKDFIDKWKPGDKDYDKMYGEWDKQRHDHRRSTITYNQKDGTITKKTVKYIHNPNYQACMTDAADGLSACGIVYFLCLFLDKSDAFCLMEQVGFTKQCMFRGENADQQLLFLKEMMCMNRIRMVKAKMDSEMSDTALALDMVNELRKCPKQLYEVFCKEARDEFKDASTVDWENRHGVESTPAEVDDGEQPFPSQRDEVEAIHGEETEESEKETPRSTFVRWEDRFPVMALKFIDLKGLFPDIRFQLYLGKYRFAFYQHSTANSIDSKERLRILQKELHGFGRIQEVNEEMKTRWADLFEKKTVEDGLTRKEPDQAGQAPYVTQQKAQYAIDRKSHSIGLRWEGWNADCHEQHYGDLDNQKMFIPYLPSSPGKAADGQRQKNHAERLLPPQCTISLYDLPAMLFCQYLLTKYGKDTSLVEQTIKDHYASLKAFLEDVSQGGITSSTEEEFSKLLDARGIRLSSIPDKLRKVLSGIKVDNASRMEASAATRLQERRDKARLALDRFLAKKKKISTKENKFDRMHATIKTGALGQLLARNIMEWLTDETKEKMRLTGQNYVAMQTTLAMFGQNFGDKGEEVDCQKLREMFTNANILPENDDNYDADLHHPFLLDVFDEEPTSVEQFYELYLKKEIIYIDYLSTLFKKHKAKGVGLYIPFLHSQRARWKNNGDGEARLLAARYLQRPLQLSDGLFTSLLNQLLDEVAARNVELAEALKAVRGNQHHLGQNAAFLIASYFDIVEHDHHQPFYSTAGIDGVPSPYRHIYRVFKKFYGEPIPHTNQTTTPAFTVEEIHALLKNKGVMKENIQNYVHEEVQKLEKQKNKDLKKYEDKQWKRLKKENEVGTRKKSFRKIQEEVNELVKQKLQEIEREIGQYEADLTKKLERMVGKVYDNERAIRRFKTQDILLLLMARSILKAKSHEREFESDFKLKYVMTDSLLDKEIDFEWTVNIEDKDKKTVAKSIRQEGMKMKNYGQFYKFASDRQRLMSLLSRLPENHFLRAEIENELSYYDDNRSEVFRLVYTIESEAYRLKPELLDDKNAGKEWFYDVETKTNKKTGKVKQKIVYVRNSFWRLLDILAAGEDGILSDEEKATLQKTRNAFGHNTYDVDLDIVFRGKESKKKIPEVANGIKDKIEEQTNEMRKKNK